MSMELKGNAEPTGNTAELIKNVFNVNTKEINTFSSAIGTLADACGAGGAVSAASQCISRVLGSREDPNSKLRDILDALQQAFASMFASFEARQRQDTWTQLATQVSAAVSVVQSLGGFVHAQPPLT